jgi:hypothetical protein
MSNQSAILIHVRMSLALVCRDELRDERKGQSERRYMRVRGEGLSMGIAYGRHEGGEAEWTVPL